MRQPTPSTYHHSPLLHRRAVLLGAAASTLAGWLPASHAALPTTSWPVTDELFGLGVASGDPSADGMVLWTRLMPTTRQPLLAMQTVQTVEWEIAHDAQFQQIVQRGEASATPQWGHSVHVEVSGLAPDRWYFYRFHCQGETSRSGRTRTAPQAGAPVQRLRLVYASCQRWEHGYYAAWRHARQDDPDLVVFLGDYIYEYASPKPGANTQLEHLARLQPLRYPRTLADYRDRYALHKSDPDLQAMHAHCPWVVTWDDHEVENNYAGADGVGNANAFIAKRLAAWQAFYENMPLRAAVVTKGLSAPQIYRRLPWGSLADLLVLDARQYRDIQACRVASEKDSGSVRPDECGDLSLDTRSFLGWQQERWLTESIRNNSQSRTDSRRWNVICQQTLFAQRHYPNGRASTDSWAGYPAARDRLIRAIHQATPRNTVLLGGDIHQNYVCRIETPPESRNTPTIVASEFCGTSITSHSGTTQAKVDAIMRRNPHVLLARCEERGYGLCTITPHLWTTELRAINDPMRADSSVHTQARFIVQDRVAGPQPA